MRLCVYVSNMQLLVSPSSPQLSMILKWRQEEQTSTFWESAHGTNVAKQSCWPDPCLKSMCYPWYRYQLPSALLSISRTRKILRSAGWECRTCIATAEREDRFLWDSIDWPTEFPAIASGGQTVNVCCRHLRFKRQVLSVSKMSRAYPLLRRKFIYGNHRCKSKRYCRL